MLKQKDGWGKILLEILGEETPLVTMEKHWRLELHQRAQKGSSWTGDPGQEREEVYQRKVGVM